MSIVRRHVSVALALLLVALPALAATKPYGGSSPQDVVARLKAAAEGKDMGEVMACLDPDSRREMAMMMVAGVGMMVAFSAMGTEMERSAAIRSLSVGAWLGADRGCICSASGFCMVNTRSTVTTPSEPEFRPFTER